LCNRATATGRVILNVLWTTEFPSEQDGHPHWPHYPSNFTSDIL
jgi:hypothetical protein